SVDLLDPPPFKHFPCPAADNRWAEAATAVALIQADRYDGLIALAIEAHLADRSFPSTIQCQVEGAILVFQSRGEPALVLFPWNRLGREGERARGWLTCPFPDLAAILALHGTKPDAGVLKIAAHAPCSLPIHQFPAAPGHIRSCFRILEQSLHGASQFRDA